MRLTAQDSRYVVFDDVLPDFDGFLRFFGRQEFASVSLSGWKRVWRPTDGDVLATRQHRHLEAPFGSKMDEIHHVVSTMASSHLRDFVGPWGDILIKSYIYAEGTRISWHNDVGYSAAAIFYAHDSWKASWGGELLVAESPPEDVRARVESAAAASQDGLRRLHDPLVEHMGVGHYISPKPNRLVFTRGGVWHCINRVDRSAGDALRCSVVCFFTPPQQNSEK